MPPKPRNKLKCINCGSEVVWFKELRIFKHWVYNQYRMDLNIKCDDCGIVLVFGIHLTEEEFEKLKKILPDMRLHYTHTGHINMNKWGGFE